jgi:carboxypeptidase Taq
MDKGIQELRARTMEISDLAHAASVLSWDQMTFMPPGGAEARGRQIALLGKLAHEKAVDPALGRLLKSLEPIERKLEYDSDEASVIRVSRRGYDIATKVPTAWAARYYKHQADSYEAWVKARPKNDFKTVLPYLQKTYQYAHEYADFFPGYDHPLDPLIDNFDFGLRARKVKGIFKELRAELVPLAKKIAAAEQVDDSILENDFPEDAQLEFGRAIAADLGYDFQRGRIDRTPHPFTTSFSVNDVRITTRFNRRVLAEALFSTIHESGHAMYEQGSDQKLEATPLAGGAGMSVHESQSRLWENVVGRSLPFWKFYYPKLVKAFPHFKKVKLADFYRAINKVQPSLIRTEADEVTYNLHIMVRFGIEFGLMEDKIKVKELPEVWNEGYERDLGVTPDSLSVGVMQDVHWYTGLVGYFECYALGNLLSSQIYGAAVKKRPAISAEIGGGKFKTLHSWLTENIYRHGNKFTTMELLKRNGLGDMEVEPFMKYLRKKYGDIYGVKV